MRLAWPARICLSARRHRRRLGGPGQPARRMAISGIPQIQITPAQPTGCQDRPRRLPALWRSEAGADILGLPWQAGYRDWRLRREAPSAIEHGETA
jgi:hypothetical protein